MSTAVIDSTESGCSRWEQLLSSRLKTFFEGRCVHQHQHQAQSANFAQRSFIHFQSQAVTTNCSNANSARGRYISRWFICWIWNINDRANYSRAKLVWQTWPQRRRVRRLWRSATGRRWSSTTTARRTSAPCRTATHSSSSSTPCLKTAGSRSCSLVDSEHSRYVTILVACWSRSWMRLCVAFWREAEYLTCSTYGPRRQPHLLVHTTFLRRFQWNLSIDIFRRRSHHCAKITWCDPTTAQAWACPVSPLPPPQLTCVSPRT